MEKKSFNGLAKAIGLTAAVPSAVWIVYWLVTAVRAVIDWTMFRDDMFDNIANADFATRFFVGQPMQLATGVLTGLYFTMLFALALLGLPLLLTGVANLRAKQPQFCFAMTVMACFAALLGLLTLVAGDVWWLGVAVLELLSRVLLVILCIYYTTQIKKQEKPNNKST